jgi:hemerythrin-like domain-containing protein
MSIVREDRRHLLEGLASAAGVFWIGCASAPQQPRATHGVRPLSPADKRENDHAPTPAEELMQEHGLIDRVLIIYDDVAMRLERGDAADTGLATSAAQIIKRFVEAYHERMEEGFVFPRLQDDPRHKALVATLLEQHAKGHALTEDILRLSQSKDAAELPQRLRSFTRMYRAHAGWEDSVLFPAFRAALSRDEYLELGAKFEEEEHSRFGEHGFRDMLGEVANIERALGIAELSKFTPA